MVVEYIVMLRCYSYIHWSGRYAAECIDLGIIAVADSEEEAAGQLSIAITEFKGQPRAVPWSDVLMYRLNRLFSGKWTWPQIWAKHESSTQPRRR